MELNPIDIAFIIVMGYGIYKAISTQFIDSIMGLMKYVLAFLVALRFSYTFSKILEVVFGISPIYTPIFGFIAAFAASLMFFHIGSIIFNLFVRAANLTALKRALSIALWLLMVLIGFSTAIMVGEQWDFITDKLTGTSFAYNYVHPIAQIFACKLQYLFPATDHILSSIEAMLTGLRDLVAGECYAPDAGPVQ